MKILIVDDDAYKSASITSILTSIQDVNREEFDHAVSALEARELMMRRHYDLLVLDVILPDRKLEVPKSEVGLKLLSDLLDGKGRYLVPDHIIGITAHQEIIEEASLEFGSRLLTLTYYDEGSDGWKNRLIARGRQIAESVQGTDRVESEFDFDVGVICALQSPELDMVLRLPWQWEQYTRKGDHTIYYSGSTNAGEKQVRVIAAAADRMGMPASCVLACKMISVFRPRFLGMVGITAGVKGKCRYGDVLIPNMCFDHGSGKFKTLEGGDIEFLPSYHHINISPAVLGKLRSLASKQEIGDKIRRSWPGDQPEHVLSMRIGPLASGAAVHADGKTIKDLLGRQRDLVGLDMESYAVLNACIEHDEPRPEGFVLKSVVDYADGTKDDTFHRYAAYTSSAALRVLVEEILFCSI